MQKSEIATYVILALVALNLILTIYYNNRSQEDYRSWGKVAAATPPVVKGTISSVATTTTNKSVANFDKDASTNKSVVSMQDPNRANLVSR